MIPIDAHLKNARWHPDWPDRLVGEIYQDAKGRFDDGNVITTSPAKKIGQGMYRTRSGTVYQVAFFKPAEELLRREIADYIASCVGLDESENTPTSFVLEETKRFGNGVFVRVLDTKERQVRRFRMTVEEIV